MSAQESHAISENPVDFVLPGHTPILDGFRGIAIILVLIYHSTIFFPDNGPVGNFLSSIILLGWSGVDMFFALSGFLITSILLRSKGKPFYFKNFYMRRILRIFPLYYLFLIIALGIPAFMTSMQFHHQLFYEPLTPFRMFVFILHFSNYLYALDGFQNYWLLHVWSLAVEEQFYMVWPFLVFMFSNRKLSLLCLVLFVCSFFFRWQLSIADPVLNQIKIFQFTHCRMDGLLMGCLIALNARNKGLVHFFRHYGFGTTLFILLIILILNFFVTSSAIENGTINGFKQFSTSAVQLFYFPFLGLFYTFWMATIYLNQQNAISNIIKSPVFQYLGRHSYGIYIYHMPILWLFLNYFPPVNSYFQQLLFWVLFFPIPIAIAHVSMKFYERPFLNLKKSFEH